jgi:hypothetical protein
MTVDHANKKERNYFSVKELKKKVGMECQAGKENWKGMQVKEGYGTSH